MNKTVSIIITSALVVALGVIFFGESKSKDVETSLMPQAQNVEIKDGIQYITIDAKIGYSPQISTAEGGIPTKLIVKTDGTYDCSASLAIHSIDYQKVLSQTGEEVIDIGIPKKGEPLQGVCGMGMYQFEIEFL